MNKTCVNIACGDDYLNNWLNFDFAPHSATVKQANLLSRLPLADNSADVVYSSHFLEHIPRDLVAGFLAECHRIIKVGGRLRLVLPDWEELCNTYLTLRRAGGGQHEQADFLLLEMLDQCVRRVSGGDLGTYYASLQAQPEQQQTMIDFVKQRTGHDLSSVNSKQAESRWTRLLKNPQKIRGKLEQWYCRAFLALLPSVFRQQNVSLASVGENHAWMYDFYTIERLLHQAGFVDVQRMSATRSSIPDFPYQSLDVTPDGQPRKGAESMYVEAVKT
jgi:SAM-dependent methyltransferase